MSCCYKAFCCFIYEVVYGRENDILFLLSGETEREIVKLKTNVRALIEVGKSITRHECDGKLALNRARM